MKVELTKQQQTALLQIIGECAVKGKDAEFIAELKRVIREAKDEPEG